MSNTTTHVPFAQTQADQNWNNPPTNPFGFSPDSGKSDRELIPNGTLAWAIFTPRGFKASSKTGGRYADVELTIVEGEHIRKKLWPNIADWCDQKNSEAYRKMGLAACTRLLECAGVFTPANPASYSQYNNLAPGVVLDKVMQDLEGKRIAVKIKVAKGQDGFGDKNEVAEWLTPNPTSGCAASWKKLTEAPAATARQGFLGGATAPTAQGITSGLTGASNTPAPGSGQAPGWLAGQQPTQQ